MDMSNITSPLWLVIKADGLEQPVQTNQTIPCINPCWNFAIRLILELPDISPAYLYFSLCTFKNSFDTPIAIARSRLGLRSMPIGSPKQFKFPLMAANSNVIAADLTCIATLSPISPKIKSGSTPNNFKNVFPPEQYYGSR